MKTTMLAPLSPEEETSIWEAWYDLVHLGLNRGPPAEGDEIPEMLEHVTALIMAGHKLRRKIADGCYYANKRAFPDSHPRTRVRVVRAQHDINWAMAQLSLTAEDLAKLMEDKT